MPEEQNVLGEIWNRRLDEFLKQVLGWEQVGSNIDIYCEQQKRKVGVDSIFAYKRNSHANQQIVFVEAKTAKDLENISRSRIEKWVTDLVDKLDCIPHSPDFVDKCQPATNATYNSGLLCLWVRETKTFSQEHLQRWLTQLNLPKKRSSLNLIFLTNQDLARLRAIFGVYESLNKEPACKSVNYFFPSYGSFPLADGQSIPFESLLSKFFFLKVEKVETVRGNDIKYENIHVFYHGKISSYPDMRFIGLAIRQFQLFEAQVLTIHTLYDPISIRSYITQFQNEFEENEVELQFQMLNVNNDISGWPD